MVKRIKDWFYDDIGRITRVKTADHTAVSFDYTVTAKSVRIIQHLALTLSGGERINMRLEQKYCNITNMHKLL